jgi:serralysin
MPPIFSLDQIIAQLQTSWGDHREGNYYKWMTTFVEYSLPDYRIPGTHNEGIGWQPLGHLQKELALEAFELWDDLIAINLEQNPFNAPDITFAYSNATYNNHDAYGNSEYDGNAIENVEIWMSADKLYLDEIGIALSGKGFLTYLHEIGHALGLSHPGSYSANDGEKIKFETHAEFAQDNVQYTVMSYLGVYDKFNARWLQDDVDITGPNWVYPSTPMLYDIAAIQAKYGADMTTRAGDTVYGDNSTAGRAAYDFAVNRFNPIFAIWDAGGIDTLDTSRSDEFTHQRIFLQEGMYSDVRGFKGNIAIAYGVTIENAIGGAGNDFITGNAAVNKLEGRSGNDELDGREGADVMIGGLGDDRYHVDQAADAVIENANEGTDTVESNSTTYTLPNAVENLNLVSFAVNGYGNNIDNVMRGNTSGNRLEGLAGNDTLDGAAGADIMLGGVGNDTYYVESVTNIIWTGTHWLYTPGDDVIEDANAGTDKVISTVTYTLPNHVENLVLDGLFAPNGYGNHLDNAMLGNGAVNRLEGFAGNDSLDGAGGPDIMLGGVGDDIYYVDRAPIFNWHFQEYRGGDQVIENANEGSDTVISIISSYTLPENVEKLVLSGASAVNGYGNDLANTITGSIANNFLDGGGGPDTFMFILVFGSDTINGFDADPAGGQDFLNISAFGITGTDFASRVNIADVGADTLVTIDGNAAQTMRLVGVGDATTVTQADFLL